MNCHVEWKTFVSLLLFFLSIGSNIQNPLNLSLTQFLKYSSTYGTLISVHFIKFFIVVGIRRNKICQNKVFSPFLFLLKVFDNLLRSDVFERRLLFRLVAVVRRDGRVRSRAEGCSGVFLVRNQVWRSVAGRTIGGKFVVLQKNQNSFTFLHSIQI